jgi:hypothetical protein
MSQKFQLKTHGKKILPIGLGLLLVATIFVVFSSPSTSGQSTALAIDGSNLVDPKAQTTSTTISLTTTNPQDVIMVCVTTTNWFQGTAYSPPVVTGIKDSAGLTWTMRAGVTASPAGTIGWRVEEWTAIAASPLSNDAITVSLSANSYTDLDAFGISGANTATPFDSSHPSATSGVGVNGATSSVATTLITTSNANDMIVGCTAIGGAIAYGSGFTALENTGSCSGCGNGDQLAPFQGLASEYAITSSPQNNLPVTFTDTSESGYWGVIADGIVALQASTTTNSTTSTSSTSSVSTQTLVTSTCTVTFAMSNGNVVSWQGKC